MKTKPFEHQLAAFHRFKSERAWALWWDTGTGKSKSLIDCVFAQYVAGNIRRLLVVAPNIVHANWHQHELPRHAWDGVDWRSMVWHSRRSKTRGQQDEAREILAHRGLAILCMTYDGICTEAGMALAAEFIRTAPTIIVGDELHRLMTHDSQRTKVMTKAGKFAVARAGLTGTPVGNSPFAVYSEIRFLDPEFWKRNGIGGYTAFKNEFATWEDGWVSGRKFPKLVEYRNLDVLGGYVAQIGDRRRREDCVDLPPQVFVKRRFSLSAPQRRAYDELRAQYRTELENGVVLEVPLALTRIMKLHRIACGHVTDDEGHLHVLGDDQPRLDALEDILEDTPERAIVWTRFRYDGQAILRRLNAVKTEHVPPIGRYAALVNGDVSARDRERSLAAFRAGDVRVLVANPMTMSEGVTLNEAKVSIYYSHDHSLILRKQSETRNYRIGQDKGVLVVDLLAEDTVDGLIVRALVEHADIAALVQGDAFKEWIR